MASVIDATTRTSRQLAVAHVDPDKVAWAWDLQRQYPPDRDAASGAANVVRTGVSELVPEITDDMLVAGTRDAEHLRLSRELNLRSAIVVPIGLPAPVAGWEYDPETRLQGVRRAVRPA